MRMAKGGWTWGGTAHMAVGLALLAATACGAAPRPDLAWGVISIGGATYRLPAAVFDGGRPYQGRQDSMLLELPLVAHADHTPAEPLQVLLVAVKGRDAAEQARGVQASVALDASISAMPRLARRGHPLKPSATPVAGAPVGLLRVGVDPGPGVVNDVFVRPPLAAVTEYVSCAEPGPAAQAPLCEHEFAGPGVSVKVTYPREALPRWDAIRRSVLGFLQGHRVDR